MKKSCCDCIFFTYLGSAEQPYCKHYAKFIKNIYESDDCLCFKARW